MTFTSPEVITGPLESFQAMSNSQQADLGGTHIVTHTSQHCTSEAEIHREKWLGAQGLPLL